MTTSVGTAGYTRSAEAFSRNERDQQPPRISDMCETTVIWKAVKGTSGKYQVSNLGEIRGPSGKILKPTLMKIGYLKVGLSLGKYKVKDKYVHVIVAEEFLEPTSEGNVINHKNHNKTDNRVSNLEIIDRTDNASHWARKRRSNEAGRKRTGFCGRGHKLDGNKVYCLTCRRMKASGEEFHPPTDRKWKETPIDGYLVSDQGDVWSKKTSRILKSGINKPGYCYVILREKGANKVFAIHRLVVEAFSGKPPGGMVVDHINGDKTDNRNCNLQAISKSENIIKSRDVLKQENRHGFKLAEKEVSEIKWFLYNTKYSQKEISKMYGVVDSHISAINLGHKWAHIHSSRPKNYKE